MYKKYITENGTLNANSTRNSTNEDLIQIRSLAGTSTASLNTSLYCVHNNIACKTCRTCGKDLDVENFVVGWKTTKQYCSIACKSSFNAVEDKHSDKILDDYSLVFDKNGNPSSGKMSKHMNLNTLKDLQEKTCLNTTDINTLLYAVTKSDFVPKKCETCSVIMNIHNFQIGYRKNQQYCSYTCKDKNSVYKSVLREGKEGVIRYDCEKYMNTRMQPWFVDKQKEVFDEFGVKILSTFDEYLGDKKQIKFSCSACSFNFTSDLSYNRSLFCKLCYPRSRQQTELTKYIQSFDFDVEIDTRKIIEPKEIDIWIPAINIGVEYDGFYHHRNKDDSKKYALAEEKGVRIIRVFEDEYKYKKDIVLSRIKSALGKTTNKIFARKCDIVELSAEESNNFLNATHMQGNVNASVKYGLKYMGELISVMTFSTPRYDKNAQWELIRFSNKLDTIVIGGASKLFSHFIKQKNPETIVSYCDVRYGTGRVYEILNFVDVGRSQSNYFYYKNGTRHSRIKFQKHKLEGLLDNFDPFLSEYENMQTNGYIKIFDNGNKIYKWARNL